jgi:hypothetical protein
MPRPNSWADQINSPPFVLLSFPEIEADNHHSQQQKALLFGKEKGGPTGRDEFGPQLRSFYSSASCLRGEKILLCALCASARELFFIRVDSWAGRFSSTKKHVKIKTAPSPFSGPGRFAFYFTRLISVWTSRSTSVIICISCWCSWRFISKSRRFSRTWASSF